MLIILANRQDVEFAVVAPPGTQTRRIFNLTGLDEQMSLFDSLQSALGKFRDNATIRVIAVSSQTCGPAPGNGS